MWVLGCLGTPAEAGAAGNSGARGSRGDISRSSGAHTTQKLLLGNEWGQVLFLSAEGQPMWTGTGPTSIELLVKIELKSLILAQIERWRHALHMQVERQRGGNPGGERRTGE